MTSPSRRWPLLVAVLLLLLLVPVAVLVISGSAGGGDTGANADTPLPSEEPPSEEPPSEEPPSDEPPSDETSAAIDGPSSSAGPGTSPTSGPSGSPEATGPAATLSPELAAQVAQIEQQVVGLRELQPRAEVPKRVLDEASFVAELARQFRRDNPAERLAAQTRAYQRLGYLPEETELETVVLDLLGSAVAGFYEPDTDRLAIVQRGDRFGPLEQTTVAHEFTHALQDQHFDLDSLELDDITEGDRGLGRLALVEGDATLVMNEWSGGNLTREELREMLIQSSDPEQFEVLARTPPILVRQLTFPYLDGLNLVSQIRERGGWAAVDKAFDSPPASTEQVLHPEKYFKQEAPVVVEVPASLPDVLGEGWRESLTDTLGELNLNVWMAQENGPSASRDASEGWGGDRFAMYEGPDDAWAIVWSTAWDSAADASEFAAAAERVETDPGGDGLVLAGGDRATVLLASNDAVLEALRQAARLSQSRESP